MGDRARDAQGVRGQGANGEVREMRARDARRWCDDDDDDDDVMCVAQRVATQRRR